MKCYGRWLAWLASNDHLTLAAGPSKRATPALVAAYVGHLRDGNAASTTVWSYVHGLAMALMVMEPEDDIEWLWGNRPAPFQGPKLRSAAKASVSSRWRSFIALALSLMDKAASKFDPDSLEGARLFRNGLMVAILAARPIRIRNLRSMEIGKNLIKANGGLLPYLPSVGDQDAPAFGVCCAR